MPKGRPPKLTDDLKAIIGYIHKKHHDWGIRTIQGKIQDYAPIVFANKPEKRDAIKELLKDKKNIPGKTTIHQYIIKELAPKLEALNKSTVNTPWHLGLINKPEYNISNDAVPFIIGIQNWAKESKCEPVTARQSKWIDRLCKFISPNLKDKQIKDALGWLYGWSRFYSFEEEMSDIIGLPLITTELDIELGKRVNFVHTATSVIAFYDNHSFRVATTDLQKLEQLNQSYKGGE